MHELTTAWHKALAGILLLVGAHLNNALGDTPVTDRIDCNAYCDCMSNACSTAEGYPYETTKACLKACRSFTPEESACWPRFCERALDKALKTSTPPLHRCEHAWGALGLLECSRFSDSE